MSLSHAVVLIDHHHAQVHQFDAEQSQVKDVKEHQRDTGQHNSAVRTEHEFFGEVCDALSGIAEVLVTGPHLAQTAFRHYVDKHRPAVSKQIAGWETVDHPSEGELVAMGRKFFASTIAK
ncbi:MAG: hypothetical protein M3081_15895 [Gemmatimonadota bacterium]|nr:hypothetical protein [Gemmatimonadota bacterium]